MDTVKFKKNVTNPVFLDIYLWSQSANIIIFLNFPPLQCVLLRLLSSCRMVDY